MCQISFINKSEEIAGVNLQFIWTKDDAFSPPPKLQLNEVDLLPFRQIII